MISTQTYRGSYTGERFKCGTVFSYSFTVPETGGTLALHVSHDGKNPEEEQMLLKLAEEGKAPYCAFLGVAPGHFPTPEGARGMRLDEYDLFCREYADFLVLELIPYLEQAYGVPLSADPDHHSISGGSSGGISAFQVAWFHPEYFRRIVMSSPSFLAMGRGNEIPCLIRKYETKPFRVYESYSEDEPNDYFGSSFCAAKEAEMALRFANYDFLCDYYPGEGHCSRHRLEPDAYRRLEWLWRDYKTVPLKAPGNSPRVRVVIPDGETWNVCDTFPEKEKPTRSVLSSDKTFLYVSDPDDDAVFAQAKSDPAKRYYHGMLHTIPGFGPRGPVDLAIDENDRLYCLTAIGIQCVRSYGLIDVILDLPDASAPLLLAFDGDLLYVKTEQGIYRRRMCARGASDVPTPPKCTSYYD